MPDRARWGGRARWHGQSLPREAERPQITLESVLVFLETGAAPTVGDAEDGARREAEILARAPALATVLPVAKFAVGCLVRLPLGAPAARVAES